MVAYVEQDLINGTATGTPRTFYVHPDHLGSTNVVTDQNGGVVLSKDYLPYGATRIESGDASLARGYIGQFQDENLLYLQARYMDPERGQFLSQDPVFWENPKAQNLMNPQALNSYAYANGNPIVNKDPNGRCVGPLVAVCIAGGIGAIGGIGFQAYNDIMTGEFGERTWKENLAAYGVAATQGAVVGAGTAVAVMTAPVGLAGTAIVGGTAGTLTFGTTYAGNYALGKPTDFNSAVIGAGTSALTGGVLKGVPQMPGRLPNFGSQAFFTGRHTQRQAAEEFFSSSMNTFTHSLNSYVSTQNYSTGMSSGGGGSSGLIQQLQALVGALQGYVSSLSGNGGSKSGK